MDNEFVVCTKSELVAIADAVRAKSGSSGTLKVSELPQAVSSTGINLDAEMNAQDAKIASQDTLIANIVSALEGKAAGGGGGENQLQTCTIVLNHRMYAVRDICVYSFTVVENGTIQTLTALSDRASGLVETIDNVLCGSSYMLRTQKGARDTAVGDLYCDGVVCEALDDTYETDVSGSHLAQGKWYVFTAPSTPATLTYNVA